MENYDFESCGKLWILEKTGRIVEKRTSIEFQISDLAQKNSTIALSCIKSTRHSLVVAGVCFGSKRAVFYLFTKTGKQRDKVFVKQPMQGLAVLNQVHSVISVQSTRGTLVISMYFRLCVSLLIEYNKFLHVISTDLKVGASNRF